MTVCLSRAYCPIVLVSFREVSVLELRTVLEKTKEKAQVLPLPTHIKEMVKENVAGTSLVVPWLGVGAFTAVATGSVPGRGSKIPQVHAGHNHLKKKRKMWYIYAMEYYIAIKKNAIMPFAATWMDLQIVILSEVSQKEKDIPY